MSAKINDKDVGPWTPLDEEWWDNKKAKAEKQFADAMTAECNDEKKASDSLGLC